MTNPEQKYRILAALQFDPSILDYLLNLLKMQVYSETGIIGRKSDEAENVTRRLEKLTGLEFERLT